MCARLIFGATSNGKEKSALSNFTLSKSLIVPLLYLLALQALAVTKFLSELEAPAATLHADLFRGLGTLKNKNTIRLRVDAVPFSLIVPDRIPIPLRGTI